MAMSVVLQSLMPEAAASRRAGCRAPLSVAILGPESAFGRDGGAPGDDGVGGLQISGQVRIAGIGRQQAGELVAELLPAPGSTEPAWRLDEEGARPALFGDSGWVQRDPV